MRQAALKSALQCEVTSRRVLGVLSIGSNAYTGQVDGTAGGWAVGLRHRFEQHLMAWVAEARVNTNKKAVLTLYAGDKTYYSNKLAMQTRVPSWSFRVTVKDHSNRAVLRGHK